MQRRQRIIGGIYKYIGPWHPGLRNCLVEIVQVHRGPHLLRDDEQICDLEPNDIVEFVPLIDDGNGRLRRSFVSSDGRASHLEPVSK